MEKRSCADRLHRIQKDVGLTNKELKSAVRDITRPREVELPKFHEKVSKQEKIKREYDVGGKKRKLMIAHWYLEEYLKPAYAEDIYREHPRFKDLVEYAYERAMELVQISTFRMETDVDPLTMFPEKPDDDLDIPDIHWKAFNQYCKTHPLSKSSDIFKRRKKFKKWLGRKHKRYYSKSYMRMYDPVFAMTTVDEKEMIKNLERITHENEVRVKKFHEMLESLVADQSIGSNAMKKFDKQTSELLKRQKTRLKSFMNNQQTPNPITFEIDDEPSVIYD